MIEFFNVLKAILFGIVEGITEWLPVSSTGHMILLDEFVKMDVSEEFWNLFLIVIQLGAIMAVVILFWKKIWPFGKKEGGGIRVKMPIFTMWIKIIVACVPAIIYGVTLDDVLEPIFYNPWCVSVALIVFGVGFILVENRNKGKKPIITSLEQLTFSFAFVIGLFQLLAAIFPGTSRSGATIIGALLLGVSRTVAAEFTFFMAIPVMLGASLLKIVKFEGAIASGEILVLIVGMIVAFFVSVFVIRFLMGYIKKHDFKVFGWYRIVLGCVVLAYFLIKTLV